MSLPAVSNIQTTNSRSQGCTRHVLFSTKHGLSQKDRKGPKDLLSLTATRNQTAQEFQGDKGAQLLLFLDTISITDTCTMYENRTESHEQQFFVK